MYDKQSKSWRPVESAASESERFVSEQDRLRAEFEEADRALASDDENERGVDAVYRMQQLAEEGYPDACLAMGQMFEYGWAVPKDKQVAIEWYKKAANAGSPEAVSILSNLRKARKLKIIIAVAAVVICLAAVIFAIFAPKIFSSKPEEKEAHVELVLPENSVLYDSKSAEERGEIVAGNQEKYDSPEMKKGNEPTNRILVIYTGEKLDLSSFNVVEAITDGDYLVLQFLNHKDAQACMDYLNSLDETQNAEYDSYFSLSDNKSNSASSNSGYLPVYHSSVSGYDYYTWGARDMGMDEYSAYLQKILPSDHHITVGVIDTGIEPQAATQSRIIPGHDFTDGSNGMADYDGHGTHVSGTILDCTQGLNVDVMPISIFPRNEECTSSSLIREGVEYAIEKNVEVINMSLGGEYTYSDSIYENAIERAIDKGICVVCAAGNESENAGDYSPAHLERCITVAAVDSRGRPSYFTNYGEVVDVSAPGEEILSYYPQPEGMAELDGTSMASPHVAALVAMMQLEFNEKPEVISFYVKSYCRDLGNSKTRFGVGMPDGRMIVE